MIKEVVWNKRAVDALEQIIEYLEENSSQESVKEFINRIELLIEKLKKYPEIGRRSKLKKTVRQYRIDKHRKLYYRKYGKKLIVVLIYDDRQNPKSNPYR